MNKNQSVEILYVKVSWALITTAFLNMLLSFLVFENISNRSFMMSFAFLAVVSISNLGKYIVLRKLEVVEENLFLLFRIVESFVVITAVVFLNLDQWAWLIVIFPISFSALMYGRKNGIKVAAYSFIIFFSVCLGDMLFYPGFKFIPLDLSNLSDLRYLVSFYFVIAAFTFLCISIYNLYLNYYDNDKKQIVELQEKCRQLTSECEEKNKMYMALENEKSDLEARNMELLSSVAEYFTLQHVSQAISSTLDIKELLKYVNDIIIGVMGVSHSTLLFYDEKKNKLKVSITSVVEHTELAALMDNINHRFLNEAIQNEKEIIENNVDPEVYTFTKGREIKSLICVPINTKSRKFGLVLAEHKFKNAFTENNARILSIIGQQVGFAMENAELYRQMQELATIDGLTGIYNRHYFHDRIQKEFVNSAEGKYDLSLLIFDIDHFKKFNDTYGHLFGDKVLRTIVDLLKGCIRSTDIFARFGGEEFILLLPRTSLNEAYERAEMLRDKVSKAVLKDELVSVSVTVSFGVSSYPHTASTENELIRVADDALYEAKNSGRNCVRTAKMLGDEHTLAGK